MSPNSRKSDKNFWTYLCSTSKSNFHFAIGSDRILTSFWFRAYKSNIDLVMENTLFIIGNLADMCSGKVVWKYETIFDTHLMWQVALRVRIWIAYTKILIDKRGNTTWRGSCSNCMSSTFSKQFDFPKFYENIQTRRENSLWQLW